MVWPAWLACALLIAAACGAVLRVPPTPPPHAGPWRVAVARFRGNRAATTALCAVLALYVIIALAPWLAPYAPSHQPDIVALKSQPPSLAHPFGTDYASRDVLSRVLYGARISLVVALLAVLLSATAGLAVGATAGFYGGRIDAVLMRLVDAAMAVPRVLLLIAILALWGALPLTVLVLLLGLTGWFGVSRLVRAQVLAVKEQEMVLAARALGVSDRAILIRHVLPNVMSVVVVAATLAIGHVIILEAGLSYLGIGVQPPTPSLGNIIFDGVDQIAAVWWVSVFPGLLIVLTVMAFNLVGDGLRDALDPRQVDGYP